MSKQILEEYINLLEDLPENELESFGNGEGANIGELGRIFMGDYNKLSQQEKVYVDTSNENEKIQTKYLSNLTDDQFYFLYNAFDLGKSYYTTKDSLQEDINHFGGEKELIQINLEHIKGTFSKEIGIHQLTGKQNQLVIKSLKGYIEKFI